MKTNPYYDPTILYKKPSKSQKKIQDALLALYKDYNENDITISMLCKKAKIARTTFYYSYENIEDVFNEIENNFLYELITVSGDLVLFYHSPDEDYSSRIEKTMACLTSNKNMLRLFLIEKPRSSFVNKWKKHFMYNFYNLSQDELTLRIVASSCLTCYEYWLIHDFPLTTFQAKQLIEYIDKTLQNISFCYKLP